MFYLGSSILNCCSY